MKKEENNFYYLLTVSSDLNQEIKNLVSSNNDKDVIRERYHETKVRTLLRRLVDELNISEVLPDYLLQIRFAKRYNFYNKEPVSFANL